MSHYVDAVDAVKKCGYYPNSIISTHFLWNVFFLHYFSSVIFELIHEFCHLSMNDVAELERILNKG